MNPHKSQSESTSRGFKDTDFHVHNVNAHRSKGREQVIFVLLVSLCSVTVTLCGM